MAGIGSMIGAGLGVASSIFGGISASKAISNVKKNVKAEKQANQDWYDRRYNEDATQRADAQAVLTQTQESIRNRNKSAAGTQAVMGGTEESVAATKEANANAMAQAASSIDQAAETRKDSIEQQYMQTDRDLQDKLNDLEMQKANAISGAVQGVASAASQI